MIQDEKNLQEETKEEKNEIIEENKEEVKAEVVEEKKPEPEDQGDEGIIVPLYVSKDSFVEFMCSGSFKQQLKTAALYSVIMCVVFYLLRNKEQETSYILAQMGIGVVAIFVVEIAFYFVQRYLIAPKQFEKNDINDAGITLKINNKGIKQLYNEKEYFIPWYQLPAGRETEKSLIFYGAQRRGMVLSKEKLNAEDLEYIRSVVNENCPQFKDEREKKKA